MMGDRIGGEGLHTPLLTVIFYIVEVSETMGRDFKLVGSLLTPTPPRKGDIVTIDGDEETYYVREVSWLLSKAEGSRLKGQVEVYLGAEKGVAR